MLSGGRGTKVGKPVPRRNGTRHTADVGAGAASRPGALGEDGAHLDVAFAGPAGLVLTSRFVVTGTQSGPRCQVRGAGEPGHVDADLGDDHLRCPFTDPRDGPQEPQWLGERGDHRLDPVIETLDHDREVVDVVGMHSGQ